MYSLYSLDPLFAFHPFHIVLFLIINFPNYFPLSAGNCFSFSVAALLNTVQCTLLSAPAGHGRAGRDGHYYCSKIVSDLHAANDLTIAHLLVLVAHMACPFRSC